MISLELTRLADEFTNHIAFVAVAKRCNHDWVGASRVERSMYRGAIGGVADQPLSHERIRKRRQALRRRRCGGSTS